MSSLPWSHTNASLFAPCFRVFRAFPLLHSLRFLLHFCSMVSLSFHPHNFVWIVWCDCGYSTTPKSCLVRLSWPDRCTKCHCECLASQFLFTTSSNLFSAWAVVTFSFFFGLVSYPLNHDRVQDSETLQRDLECLKPLAAGLYMW